MCLSIPECYNLTKEEKEMLLAISNGVVRDSVNGYKNYKPEMSDIEKKTIINNLCAKNLIITNTNVFGCDFWMIVLSEKGRELINISPKLKNRQIRKFIYRQMPTNKKMRMFSHNLTKIISCLFTLICNK